MTNLANASKSQNDINSLRQKLTGDFDHDADFVVDAIDNWLTGDLLHAHLEQDSVAAQEIHRCFAQLEDIHASLIANASPDDLDGWDEYLAAKELRSRLMADAFKRLRQSVAISA